MRVRSVVGMVLSSALVAACSLDFDALDPRVSGSDQGDAATTSTSTTSTSTTTGGGEGGAGGEGGTGDQGGAGGSGELGPFTDAKPITTVNTALDEDDPTLTDDLLELYFNSDQGMNGTDIYVSTRSSPTAPWGPPAVVAELSTPSTETNCEISGDGLTIWFSRRVSGSGTGLDIYRATRKKRGEPWEMPEVVVELSSSDQDFFGRTTDDGLYLLMSSDRADPNGDSSIFEATRSTATAPWSPPSLVPSLSPVGSAFEVWLSNDGLEAWFTKTGNDTQQADLYRATRSSRTQPWGPPSPVEELNTAANDADAHLGPDLRYLVFTRTISVGNRDLYEASR